MKKLSLLGLLLCLALSVNTLSSCCCMDFAETLEDVVANLNASEGLEFTSNGDGTCYVSGIGSCEDADIVIPKRSPDRDRVTSIGDYAFALCTSLTSVVIPDSVTNIGDYAFYCTSLTSVVIPHSVTSIGERAFYWCPRLTSVTIPDSVTSIGDWAFYSCSSLTSITVDGNNANYKSIDGNLYTKDGTTLIQYAVGKTATSFVIPDRVTSIGDYAFRNCSRLTSVVIPDSVTSIGWCAFYYCSSLTSVEIPDSVTSIGDYAFYDCSSLIYNQYDNGLYLGNTSNPYAVLIKTKDRSVTTCEINEATRFIYSGAFSYCSSLTSVVIPDSVTSIGDSAFSECSSLTSVVIPDSVTSIGVGAFSHCTSLTSVAIPDSVTSIGDYAFSRCTSLTNVVIPDSVTSIGAFAFAYCSSLTSITVDGNNDNYKSIDGNLYTKDETTLIQYAVGKTATSFVIPDSVTSIGYSAFSDCDNLTSVEIPDSVTSIGDDAFYDCSSLTSITVDANNDNYKSIDGNLYTKDETTLIQYAVGKTATSFVIPDSVTSIGDYAFYSCFSLTSVTFENPNGWWYANDSDATSGTSLSSDDLSDPSVAADYLRVSYYDRYWFRD